MKFRTPSIVLVALTLITAGCSKKAAPVPKTIDVGVVEMANGVPTEVDLKNGSTCRITSKAMGDGSLMLNMEIEKGGTVVASPRAPATPDKPVTLSIGDDNLTLTPHMK